MKNKMIGTKMMTVAIAMFLMLGFVASIGAMAVGVDTSIVLTERGEIYIWGDDFTLANGVSNGTGIASDPYIIENWEINGTATEFAIFIDNTDAYCIIRNCELYSARGDSESAGVNIYDSNNITIEDCTIYDNDVGVKIYDSYNSVVINCDIYENGIIDTGGGGFEFTGIYIISCEDIIISSNHLSYENTVSIFLYNSEYCIVENNYIANGTEHGIHIERSRHNIIRNNYVIGCLNGLRADGGLEIDGQTEYNEIINNTFINNIEKGIFLLDTEYNTFYYNTLIGNDLNVLEYNSVFFNDGVYNNIWYSSDNIGNYFDDYTGEDTDGDGIGEEPYPVYDELAVHVNNDMFPLVAPYSAENTYMTWGEIITTILIAILPFIIILLIFKEIQKSFAKEVKK